MNFCEDCNSLMFPMEDREGRNLVFRCKGPGCNNLMEVTRHRKEYKIYTEWIKGEEETNLDAVINPDVILDPSLPRTRDVHCPQCGYNEAVFFNTQSNNEDEAMTLVFLCARPSCKKYWKSVRKNDRSSMSPSPGS